MVIVLIAGLQLGASERLVSDPGSVVQTNRIDSELLYSAGRDDTHVHADRPAFGGQTTEPPDGHHAQFESK